MRTHIVYAHPSTHSFTHAILTAFTAGLAEAGHSFTISDLYQMNFQPILTQAEYERESTGAIERPVADEVAAEQAKLEAADAWAFIYPVWWTDCPAILKGWFDRVWSVGWAYPVFKPRSAVKALVLCTAGNTTEHLQEFGKYQAMETVMLTDRIYDRAQLKEFHLFGGSETLPKADWPQARAVYLARAQAIGRGIGD